jgi:hypothetical protein
MQMRRYRPSVHPAFVALVVLVCSAACGGDQSVTAPSPQTGGTISSDAGLFGLVTQVQPFGTYAAFPDLEVNAAGVLPGTGPHVPMVRVRMNAQAAGVLQNGRLPSGARFPDGSVLFKEIITSAGDASLYAVMYKNRDHSLAGNGWLWAEYRTNGSTAYSISNRGSACTGCHSLSDGARNDSVRIFERQR